MGRGRGPVKRSWRRAGTGRGDIACERPRLRPTMRRRKSVRQGRYIRLLSQVSSQETPAMQNATRKSAKDFARRLLDLYDDFCHGRIDRRQFVNGVSKFAVGGVTAAALVDMLMPDYALAQQVAANDPRIVVSQVTFDSPKGYGPAKG